MERIEEKSVTAAWRVRTRGKRNGFISSLAVSTSVATGEVWVNQKEKKN